MKALKYLQMKSLTHPQPLLATILLVTISVLNSTNRFIIAVNAQEEQKPSYSLNLSLQGLANGGSISVKENKSGQTISSISTNGEYSFSNNVAVGKSFRVKITSQPNDPKQTCTIENGNGTMSKRFFKKKKIIITCRTPIEHVVIIGIDGMGGAYVREEESSQLNVRKPNLPTLNSLQLESSWTYLAQNAKPTSSSTNWVSMLGGNPPDVHGVLSNSWDRGDSVIPPTLFAVTREKYPTAQIGLFYDWGGLGRLIEDDVADVKSSPGDASETTAAANDYIIDNHPLLTFVHLDQVDYAGHGHGWGSEQYVEALESADSMVGNIINTLKNEGIWENTALLISSDHGGEGGGHGGDTYLERAVPFIVRTPQSEGNRITREVRIWDIAATAAALLGVDHPKYWHSTPAYEAIPFSSEWESMTTLTNYYKEVKDFSLVYDSSGTGLNYELSIMRPVVPQGFLSLGDLAFPSTGIISECELDETSCSCLSDQSDYRGSIATTEEGKVCQKWTDQFPHEHTRTPENYPNAGLENGHNYCRNPDGEDRAWCYTTDASERWDSCSIPSCPTSDITTVVVLEDHPSVAYPLGYELIWSSEGSTDEKQLTLWNPIPPPGGYSCPGQVAKASYEGQPALSDAACILESYLSDKKVSGSNYIWHDSGSGATMDGSIWKCKVEKGIDNVLDPKLFISRRRSDDPGKNDCRVLKKWKFILCEDDTNFRFKNKNKFDCVWVGKSTKKRCKKNWRGKRVFDYCPVACNKC
jgi:hypothetical protein